MKEHDEEQLKDPQLLNDHKTIDDEMQLKGDQLAANMQASMTQLNELSRQKAAQEQAEYEKARDESNLDYTRRQVKKHMPRDRREIYDKNDLKQIQSRQERMVVDMDSLGKQSNYRAMKKLGKLMDTRAELDEINLILYRYHNGDSFAEDVNKLADIDTQNLRFRQTLDLAHLLVNEKSKSDSPEMKELKADLIRLSMTLENMKDVTVDRENMVEVSSAFELAVKSMEHYLAIRKPKSPRGKRRYNMVFDVWKSLSFQNDLIKLAKGSEAAGQLEEGTTFGQIFHMTETHANDVKRQDKPLQDLYGPIQLSREGREVAKVFREGFDFSEKFSQPGIREATRKAECAKTMAFYNALKKFKPGQLRAEYVEIYGKTVRLLQKEDNTLFLVEDGQQYRLDHSAEYLSNHIEGDIFKKASAYGDENILKLAEEYGSAGDLTTGQHQRLRENVTEYLSKRLGIQKDVFTTILRTNMTNYTIRLLRGEMTEDEVRQAIQNNVKSENLINGMEMTELLEINEHRQGLMQDKVRTMYEIENRIERNDWSEEEKAVQNLMADFVYTEDTFIMDKNADQPEEYLRTVLLKNSGAIATLIKQGKDADNDLISDIFKKMSLDEVKGATQTSFERVIAFGLRDITSFLGAETDLNRSVDEIKAQIETKLNDRNLVPLNLKLKQLATDVNKSIDNACNIMQDNVSEMTDSIFDKTEKDEETSLKAIMENACRSEKGQGLFTRTVFKNYFRSMSAIDKRSMLSSVLRLSTKVDYQEPSDQELLRDIRERKLAKYPSLAVERNLDAQPLTHQEREQLDAYRAEKKRLKVGANYLAGLIRGAGPLFQKMLQGLPEESLPVEIRKAMSDVKARLAPIPERVVKAQLLGLIEGSGGAVTKIDVEKSLGAATVGETFRCRIYGPNLPVEGRPVVIKLLRSDVQNRMKREEKVMLDCAKQSDESNGMYETYKGQLSNFYAELNFTKEAENVVELGKVYRGKKTNVKIVELNQLFNATTNCLIEEEAEGDTLDAILRKMARIREEMRSVFKNVSEVGFNKENIQKTKEWRDRFVDEANKLIKQRDLVADMCNIWVDEAIFKSGYYHADLHAGNIMVSKDKATMIDFGNAAKFDANQQDCITRMTAAAGMGNAAGFFAAFNDLLLKKNEEDKTEEDLAFEQFYDEDKRAEVLQEFEKIMDMGDEKQAGERISCALIKAQELGIKLPPAIYNFSQGQLRLQKSINDINDMVENLKKDIDWLDNIHTNYEDADPVNYIQNVVAKQIRDAVDQKKELPDRKAVFESYINMLEPVNKEDFVKGILDNTHKDAQLDKGIAEIDKRKEFDRKYLNGIMGISEALKTDETMEQDEEGNEIMVEPDYEQYRVAWEDYKAKWRDKKGSPEQINAGRDAIVTMQPMDVKAPVYQLFGGFARLSGQLMNALEAFDEEAVEDVLKAYFEEIPLCKQLEAKVKELRSLQDRKKLNDNKKQQLTDEIYELYTGVQKIRVRNNPLSKAVGVMLENALNYESVEKQMQMLFEDQTPTKVMVDGKEEERPSGPELKAVFLEYKDLYMQNMDKQGLLAQDAPAQVKAKLDALREKLYKIHQEISTRRIKQFYEERFAKKTDIKSYDFTKVMKDVVNANIFKFGFRVGMDIVAQIMKNS